FAVPGKVALYLESGEPDPAAVKMGGETIGLAIGDDGGSPKCFFIPSCARMTEDLARRLSGAALVFFDGTLWRGDEVIRRGLGSKSGRRMGHMSVDGADGTIAAFKTLGVTRKILIHINNSNPVLLEDSPERASAAAAGWEVAYDGMEITL